MFYELEDSVYVFVCFDIVYDVMFGIGGYVLGLFFDWSIDEDYCILYLIRFDEEFLFLGEDCLCD